MVIQMIRGRKMTQLLKSRQFREAFGKAIILFILSVGALAMLLPFLWMLSTAVKPDHQIFLYPPKWIPDPIMWGNFSRAWTFAPFNQYLLNTLFITITGVFGCVLSASLVAYAFARLEWPGRNFFFFLLITTMMLPEQITMIPLFLIFRDLGWINTFMPLIVPAFLGGGAFNIFLLRQFFKGIPRELEEAAVIDGCSTLRIWAQIIIPLSRPALAAVAIFTFVGTWKDFMKPLIYLFDESKFTLQLGLYMFNGLHDTEWALLMAASTLIILPCVVLFFAFQKYFVEGIVVTGIKG